MVLNHNACGRPLYDGTSRGIGSTEILTGHSAVDGFLMLKHR